MTDTIKIEEDGYPSDDFLAREPSDPDSPYTCLWAAMGNISVILYADPDNKPAQAAVWQIQEAIVKIIAGEEFMTPATREQMEARLEELRHLAPLPSKV